MADLQLRVKELEKRVDKLTVEREELYKDIESLCLQNDDSFWSGSAVLSTRIGIAERTIEQRTAENSRLKAQCDSLREDLTQLRNAKRDTDRISKEEIEKNRVLDRELMFYKKQCARALEDRNLFSYEVEELKRANLELERKIGDAEGHVKSEAVQRSVVERKLHDSENRVATLEGRLVECARIPELEAQLQESRGEANRLRAMVTCLEGDLEGTREDLEEFREEVRRLREAQEAVVLELHATREEATAAFDEKAAQVEALEEKLAAVSSRLKAANCELQEADSAVAAAQAQVELVQSECERDVAQLHEEYQMTIQDLESQVARAEDLLHKQAQELQEVTQAKVAALVKMSEWQAKAAHSEQRAGELEVKFSKLEHMSTNQSKEPPSSARSHSSQDEGGPRSWFNWPQGKQASGQNIFRNVETHV